MLNSNEVQVVENLFDSLETGDRKTFLELQTPAVIWEVDGNVAPIAPNTTQFVDIIPFAGTWYAPEGANLINRTTNDFFEHFQESLEISKLEPLDFFQDDDRVVARANLEAVVRDTDLPIDLDLAFIIDLDESENGRVQIDNVRVKYHSLTVARAFANEAPSPEVVDIAADDPLTGEPQSADSNTDSEESLKVVQDAYANFLAGDIANFSQAFAEDGVFVVSSDPEFLPQSGVWQGPDGVQQALTSGFQSFTPTVFVPRFIANGDRVAVTSQQLGLSNENNFSFDTDGVQFLTVEDGFISSWQVLLNDYTSASAIAGEPLFLDNETSTNSSNFSPVESEFVFDGIEGNILEAGLDFDGNQNNIFAGAGDDLVDTSQTTTNRNHILGGTGLDELLASQGDRIYGGTGDDILDASVGRGDNRLYGGEGNDELFAGSGDSLFAGEGDDLLDATTGNGNNRLYGQDGNDTFFVGEGDRLLGGDGDDAFFITDGGDNLITGGNGADAFWITTGEITTTANTITDFEMDTDVIRVAGIGATSVDDLEFSQMGDDAVISFSGFDLATLSHTQVSDLQSSDAFVFA